MPILPIAVFEADLEADRALYQTLKPPTSIVVRFGVMKMVGEFPYDGEAKPGCGSKMVVRTHRGVEIGEMLTSTCPNAGCSKSVTRKEMLEYIENSGGRDYPFFSGQGKVLRVATAEDLNEQSRLEGLADGMLRTARACAAEMGHTNMKLVSAEPILGKDRLTFYYNSEDRIDFRELVFRLAAEYQTRIEMRQIGARDEARLTADYERCGQHCCCKQFLKVLKPVSMKSAKVQKATLDPLKISGRCGRLMCCLRYEDQTYAELAARLPKKKTRVHTSEGIGTVIDGQILTQLVLVQLDDVNQQIAVPLEDIEILTGDAARPAPPRPTPTTSSSRPSAPGAPPSAPGTAPIRGDGPRRTDRPQGEPARPSQGEGDSERPPRSDHPNQPRERARSPVPESAVPPQVRQNRPQTNVPPPAPPPGAPHDDAREHEVEGEQGMTGDPGAPGSSGTDQPPPTEGNGERGARAEGSNRRRRRRRRRPGGGQSEGNSPGPRSGPAA
ncbi:MAG: hypothetical protein H7Y88_05830 [Phycisphaerales bacterium]|nr:hypothetical protein [Phycisphaerales bacterium]